MKAIEKIILSAVFILIAVSCKKDDGLPKASQTGAHIMAAKINGKVWRAKACWSCIGGGSGLRIDYSNGDFYIKGEQNDDENKITISLTLNNLNKIGNYNLSEELSNNAVLSDYKISDSPKYYHTTINNQGSMSITKIDITKKIISGTFQFTAEDKNNSGNTIRVTDGRFDVKYK